MTLCHDALERVEHAEARKDAVEHAHGHEQDDEGDQRDHEAELHHRPGLHPGDGQVRLPRGALRLPLLRRVPHRDRAFARRGLARLGLTRVGGRACLEAGLPWARPNPSPTCLTAGTSAPGTTASRPAGRASPTRTRPGKRTAGRPSAGGTLDDGRPEGAAPDDAVPEDAAPRRRATRRRGARRRSTRGRGVSTRRLRAGFRGISGGRGRPGRGGRRRAEAERRRVIAGRLLGDLARRGLPVLVRILRPAAARCPYGVRGQRGHAVGDGGVGGGRAGSVLRGGGQAAVGQGVLAAVGRSVLGRSPLDPVPGRRRAVGRKARGWRTVGYGIIRRYGLGGSGLGCGRLLRRPPGRCHDVARQRVLLVTDQVITGSP